MFISEWLSISTNFTEVTLMSKDTFGRKTLQTCASGSVVAYFSEKCSLQSLYHLYGRPKRRDQTYNVKMEEKRRSLKIIDILPRQEKFLPSSARSVPFLLLNQVNLHLTIHLLILCSCHVVVVWRLKMPTKPISVCSTVMLYNTTVPYRTSTLLCYISLLSG